MSKLKLVYLIWLLPAYLLFLTCHQALVWKSMQDTYDNGQSYSAEVTDFDIKQIAAQTNGFVVLRFETGEQTIEEQLSLPVELASMIQGMGNIPVRYRQGALTDIVIMPIYQAHNALVLSNIGLSGVGLLITIFVAILVHRYTNRKIAAGQQQIVIERVD